VRRAGELLDELAAAALAAARRRFEVARHRRVLETERA
jgi:hypothetical protein